LRKKDKENKSKFHHFVEKEQDSQDKDMLELRDLLKDKQKLENDQKSKALDSP